MGFFKNLFGSVEDVFGNKKTTHICPGCGSKVNIKNKDEFGTCDYCGCEVKNTNHDEFVKSIERANAISKSYEVKRNDFNDCDLPFDDFYNKEFDFKNGNKIENVDTKMGPDGEYPAFALVKRSGFSYSGEILGITFTSVNFCNSFGECYRKLMEKYRENKKSILNKTNEVDIQAYFEKYRNDSDVKILRIN